MKRTVMSRAHLFLVELIIATLFFALAGAVAVQVFVKAHELTAHSSALNGAVIAAQSAAETDRVLAFTAVAEEPRTLYFNKEWQRTSAADASYLLAIETAVEERAAGTMVTYTYRVLPSEEPRAEAIYSLTSKKYYGGN